MSVDTFEMYWEAMRVIDAQEMMRSFTIGDYPNQSSNNRRKIHRQVHKFAYPSTWDNAKPKLSMDQFFGKPLSKDADGK